MEENILNSPIFIIVQNFKFLENVAPFLKDRHKTLRRFVQSTETIQQPIDKMCCFIFEEIQET